MKDVTQSMTMVGNVLSHILPVAVTVLILFGVWAFCTYLPYLQYIKLLTDATDEEGIEDLAKYMAKKNGGKHIDTDHCWEAFVPAARAVSVEYRKKN